MSIVDKLKKKSVILEQHRNEGTLSSAAMIKSFMGSTIHTDFINEIEVQLEDYRFGLEDPEGSLSGRECDALRGVILALRNNKEIFTLMYENALTDQENRRDDNDS